MALDATDAANLLRARDELWAELEKSTAEAARWKETSLALAGGRVELEHHEGRGWRWWDYDGREKASSAPTYETPEAALLAWHAQRKEQTRAFPISRVAPAGSIAQFPGDTPVVRSLEALRVRVPDWQPIETAPVDEEFLGYFGHGEQHVVYLDKRGECHREMDLDDWSRPTHWMPLPEPPAEPT